MEIKEAQQLAWANKIAKGFNTSDVSLEFMLLHGEIAESFQAWRRDQGRRHIVRLGGLICSGPRTRRIVV